MVWPYIFNCFFRIEHRNCRVSRICSIDLMTVSFIYFCGLDFANILFFPLFARVTSFIFNLKRTHQHTFNARFEFSYSRVPSSVNSQSHKTKPFTLQTQTRYRKSVLERDLQRFDSFEPSEWFFLFIHAWNTRFRS